MMLKLQKWTVVRNQQDGKGLWEALKRKNSCPGVLTIDQFGKGGVACLLFRTWRQCRPYKALQKRSSKRQLMTWPFPTAQEMVQHDIIIAPFCSRFHRQKPRLCNWLTFGSKVSPFMPDGMSAETSVHPREHIDWHIRDQTIKDALEAALRSNIYKEEMEKGQLRDLLLGLTERMGATVSGQAKPLGSTKARWSVAEGVPKALQRRVHGAQLGLWRWCHILPTCSSARAVGQAPLTPKMPENWW